MLVKGRQLTAHGSSSAALVLHVLAQSVLLAGCSASGAIDPASDATPAPISPTIVALGDAESGMGWTPGRQLSSYASSLAARGPSASAGLTNQCAEFHTCTVKVVVVGPGGKITNYTATVPGAPTSLILDESSIPIIAGPVQNPAWDPPVATNNRAYLQALDGEIHHFEPLPTPTEVISVLPLDRDAAVALTIRLEYDGDIPANSTLQPVSMYPFARIEGLGRLKGRSVSTVPVPLGILDIGYNKTGPAWMGRTPEGIVAVQYSNQFLNITLVSENLELLATRPIAMPNSQRWTSFALRPGGGFVLGGGAIRSSGPWWRRIAAVDSALRPLWFVETSIGGDSAKAPEGSLFLGTTPLLASATPNRLLSLDLLPDPDGSWPQLVFLGIPSTPMPFHSVLKSLVPPVGTAAPGTAGRPTFIIETADGAHLVITDNWGRTSVPDPDPCGGDGPDACDDGDACTADGCTEAGCVHTKRAEGELCDLDGRVCQAGACVLTAK